MIAVIDTSALITFYLIDRISYLNLLYKKVLIPIEVESQFLKKDSDKKYEYLTRLYEENIWIEKCQTYHGDIFNILRSEPRIHEGEREALAQYKSIETDLIVDSARLVCVLDEYKARKVATNMQINITGTLYILARLHFNNVINYFDITENIKQERRFSDELIHAAYNKVQQELGIL